MFDNGEQNTTKYSASLPLHEAAHIFAISPASLVSLSHKAMVVIQLGKPVLGCKWIVTFWCGIIFNRVLINHKSYVVTLILASVKEVHPRQSTHMLFELRSSQKQLSDLLSVKDITLISVAHMLQIIRTSAPTEVIFYQTVVIWLKKTMSASQTLGTTVTSS